MANRVEINYWMFCSNILLIQKFIMIIIWKFEIIKKSKAPLTWK